MSSKFHRRMMSNTDGPLQIAWRTKDNRARDLARSDADSRYPEITKENAAEAIKYFEERRDYWFKIINNGE